MPRMDGTGPTGQGPMTGRRMGPCVRGMRMGQCFRGRGMGQNELQSLKDEEKALTEDLKAVKTRIETLKD